MGSADARSAERIEKKATGVTDAYMGDLAVCPIVSSLADETRDWKPGGPTIQGHFIVAPAGD